RVQRGQEPLGERRLLASQAHEQRFDVLRRRGTRALEHFAQALGTERSIELRLERRTERRVQHTLLEMPLEASLVNRRPMGGGAGPRLLSQHLLGRTEALAFFQGARETFGSRGIRRTRLEGANAI